VQALKTAKIGEESSVTANTVQIISTGNLTTSDAAVRLNTTVSAGTLLIRASRDARIGEGTVIDATNIRVESTGTAVLSNAIIAQLAQVTSGTLALVSGNFATVGPSAVIEVSGNFEMSAQTANKCSIAASATITAGSTTGVCLP
jgi:hypothetical protein